MNLKLNFKNSKAIPIQSTEKYYVQHIIQLKRNTVFSKVVSSIKITNKFNFIIEMTFSIIIFHF